MTLRLLQLTLISAVALGLAIPALAGGPLEPPDGVGNPSSANYTGYAIHGFVFGAKDTVNQRTEFRCFNFGGADATDVAVQFYSDAVGVTAPSADMRLGSLPIADFDPGLSDSASGTVPTFAMARIIVLDLVRKRNPALTCKAYIVDKATNDFIAELDVVPAPRKKKKKK